MPATSTPLTGTSWTLKGLFQLQVHVVKAQNQGKWLRLRVKLRGETLKWYLAVSGELNAALYVW